MSYNTSDKFKGLLITGWHNILHILFKLHSYKGHSTTCENNLRKVISGIYYAGILNKLPVQTLFLTQGTELE